MSDRREIRIEADFASFSNGTYRQSAYSKVDGVCNSLILTDVRDLKNGGLILVLDHKDSDEAKEFLKSVVKP